MSQNDRLKANFVMLEACACDIDRFLGSMSTHLSDLETRLEGKMADWGGATREAYKTEKLIWDGAASNISTLLHSISKAVRNSKDEYMATELRCASRFETTDAWRT